MTHNPNHPAGGAGAVKVKPLEWHKSHMTPWAGDYHTLPTAYTVRCADENGWAWHGLGAQGWASSPEAAQAEAQRHHEARILSALSPTPTPEPGRKPFRMLVDRDWVREKIASDPDDSNCCAGKLAAPAPAPVPEAEGEAVWLIRKDGYWYRPNRQGYTTVKAEAGRYTESEAKAEASIEPGMSAIRADDVPDPVYTRPSSEAEIADLRAKLEGAREAGMRDMLNAILALNPEVAAKVARWREPPSPPNPEGKIPFEVALWVTEVATQLGIKSREEMGEDPLSLAGEEKTGASDV